MDRSLKLSQERAMYYQSKNHFSPSTYQNNIPTIELDDRVEAIISKLKENDGNKDSLSTIEFYKPPNNTPMLLDELDDSYAPSPVPPLSDSKPEKDLLIIDLEYKLKESNLLLSQKDSQIEQLKSKLETLFAERFKLEQQTHSLSSEKEDQRLAYEDALYRKQESLVEFQKKYLCLKQTAEEEISQLASQLNSLKNDFKFESLSKVQKTQKQLDLLQEENRKLKRRVESYEHEKQVSESHATKEFASHLLVEQQKIKDWVERYKRLEKELEECRNALLIKDQQYLSLENTLLNTAQSIEHKVEMLLGKDRNLDAQ